MFQADFTFSIFQLSCLKDKEAKCLPVHIRQVKNSATLIFVPFPDDMVRRLSVSYSTSLKVILLDLAFNQSVALILSNHLQPSLLPTLNLK